MINSKTHWELLKGKTEPIIHNELDLSPIIQEVIQNRKLASAESMMTFINEDKWHDYRLFSQIERAVARINKAIDEEEPILIYGDYDADGVTATSILMNALTEKGAMVDFYIPNRFYEGYGPNEDAFMQAIADGFQLIITVDNGIAAIEEAKLLIEHQVDLIITDHHQPKVDMPQAFAILHPELDETYPFDKLCGAGVALKLAEALYDGKLSEDYYVYAMLGTIGDVVPLIDENRAIVKRGLNALKETNHEGLKALVDVTGTKLTDVSEVTIGFELCPRLNAPGRMEDARLSVELLIATEREEAKTLANQIEQLNSNRQKETQKVMAEAEALITPEQLKEKKVIILHQNHWHEGILGIVAGRLAKMWQKAVFVLSDDHEGMMKGSARAVEGFDLFEMLSACSNLIEKFGGHALAAGITLEPSQAKLLEQRLNEIMIDKEIRSTSMIDFCGPLSELTLELVEEFQVLSPFGEGNRPPLIQINHVQIDDVKCIGNKSQHLKFSAKDNQHKVDVIAFNMSALFIYLTPETKFDLVGELKINEWNGKRTLQFQLQDIRCQEFQLIDMRNTRVYQDYQKDISNSIKYSDLTLENDTVSTLWIDVLPESKDDLLLQIKKKNPMNIVLAPLPSDVTFPPREKFITVYKIVKQQKSFVLNSDVMKYFSQIGIVKNELLFILQVFFEVELVIIRNGSVFCNDAAIKRDLSEAPLYQTQKQKIEMLEFFELSTWRDMKLTFMKAREENSYES